MVTPMSKKVFLRRFEMAKSIAVTGASGYIGKMLIDRLLEKSDVERIVAVDIYAPDSLQDGVEFARFDVRDPDIRRCFKGCDTIIHLAFIVGAINDLKKTYDINVNGSINVFTACEELQPDKLVVASSIAAYGEQPNNNRPITEDTPLRGNSDSYYGHTKRIMEDHLDVFEKRNPDVICTRLRPSILLGPNTKNFAKEMAHTPLVPLVREGAYNPVVHEDDVIDAFELAVDKDVPGAFIIALPESMELADMVAPFNKKSVKISIDTIDKIARVLYPLRLTKFPADWVVLARTNWKFDTTRAREILGWEPKHTAEEAVAQIVDRLQKKSALDKILKR